MVLPGCSCVHGLHSEDFPYLLGRAEVEEDDRARPRFLGGNNSFGRKKSWGLNIGDSIEDGGTIVGGGIEHPSETMVFHNEDGNPARANIKQALGVKASANSDVMYFFTSAQDGDPSQDDVRLCLGDDLKKAQDHSLRQAGDLP
ncbi:hypothetical protein Tco_0639703 [Tanacetum coccineum]